LKGGWRPHAKSARLLANDTGCISSIGNHRFLSGKISARRRFVFTDPRDLGSICCRIPAPKGAPGGINAAPYQFKLMFLIAATCGLRIGEVTALKRSSLDFKRKIIHITAALDYSTRKECVPKTANSAAPLPMSVLLEQYLRTWLEKYFRPNPQDYLFLNVAGRPYLSDEVVRKIHSIVNGLQIARPEGGVHVGIHCFQHGVTSELLQAGTPIHLVTRMMRHGDPHVTLAH